MFAIQSCLPDNKFVRVTTCCSEIQEKLDLLRRSSKIVSETLKFPINLQNVLLGAADASPTKPRAKATANFRWLVVGEELCAGHMIYS